MKLSELIEQAQKSLDKYGDLSVLTEDVILQQLINVKLTYIEPSILDIDGIIIKNSAFIEVEYDRR